MAGVGDVARARASSSADRAAVNAGMFNPDSRMTPAELLQSAEDLGDGKVVVIQVTPPAVTGVMRWCGQLVRLAAGKFTFEVSPDFNAIPGVMEAQANKVLRLPDDITDYRVDWLVGLHAWSSYVRKRDQKTQAALEAENEKLRHALQAARRSPSPAHAGAGDAVGDVAECLRKLTEIEERKSGKLSAPPEGRRPWLVSSPDEWGAHHFVDEDSAQGLANLLESKLVNPWMITKHGTELRRRFELLESWMLATSNFDQGLTVTAQIDTGKRLWRRLKRLAKVAEDREAYTEAELEALEAQADEATGDIDRNAAKLKAKAKTKTAGAATPGGPPKLGVKRCYRCGRTGHLIATCRMPPKNGDPTKEVKRT
jgi:hypothetical protein